MTIYSGLKTKILKAQGEASKDLKAPAELLRGLDAQFERWDDDGIYFMDHIWIPSIGDVRTLIIDEAHTSKYYVHPGAYKKYYDLRDLYWWPVIKKDIVRKEKVAPQYVGPFEIVERVGPVAYRLKLPQELSSIHDTFYVSNLKKCLAGANLQVPLEEIEIDDKLHFVEEPVEIVDREVKNLKRIRIPIVKVC
uniref:Putative reverse transcriptase domain-containing protein n=1 Tax=Tanacetum cinerariifolium TaxID=118510 RepID=A0A699GWK6_TANCI|nr:putative reverse transcriptase domain-containing protein [Tanacetum cinerariifolium]